MSFEIKRRPFAIEPLTGIMMPDGIFDTALVQQKIGCYLTNTSDKTVDGVSIWVRFTTNAGFVVATESRSAQDVAPGAAILFEWPVSLVNATPGEVSVTFGYTYWINYGSHYGMFGSLVYPLEIVKKVFITETTYDQTSKTYSCSVPEGTLTAKITGVIGPKKLQKWKDPNYARKHVFPGPLLLTDFELSVTPASPYSGQLGELPFKDPWWKVVAWIIFVVALVAAIIAALLGYGTAYIGMKGEDFVDHETGDPACYNCEVDTLGGPAMFSVAGVLSIVAMVALVVALMDEADPFHRGQLATNPGSGEKTKAERVKVKLKYMDAPTPGTAYRMGVNWQYTRVTNKKEYKHKVDEVVRNTHLLKNSDIKLSHTTASSDQPILIEATFYRTARDRYQRDDLYVNAMLKAPNGQSCLVRLVDVSGKGVYTHTFTPLHVAACWSQKAKDVKGKWEVYVTAQDTNDAAENLDPLVAATHIGGYPIYTPFQLSIDGSESCPNATDAEVTVS